MEPGTGKTGSAQVQISYSKTERGGLEMGLRSEPQHWGPTGQIKARGVGAVGRVTGETRRTGTGNGSWAGEGVSGPQGEGLRDPDGQCAPEDQVGDRSGGRAQGEAGTAHSSTGRRSVAEGGSPRTRGHAPPKEEETQRRKGRAGRCQRSKVGVRGSQQLPSRSPGWALMPRCLAVCAFPYLLAFTTDSMEIRLVVNGNLVHTAVVPQLQLVASRVSIAGVYFCLRGFGHPQNHEVSGGRGYIHGETDDDNTTHVLR